MSGYNGVIYRGGGPVRLVRGVTSRSSSAVLSGVDFRPHARAQYEVHLESAGLRVIEDELRLMSRYRVETGGLLLSFNPNRVMSSRVIHATGPAPNAKHGRDSVTLGRSSDIEASLPELMQRANFVTVGLWHSHPGDDGRPSRTDMETWAHELKRSGRSRYVGLIATRDTEGHGWMFPKFSAWVCRTDGPGRRYVVEPARICE